MADASDIEDVKDLLPASLGEEGWNDEKIGKKLDAGNSVYAVVQKYWESRAAHLYTAIDVNESGSVRSLSRLYENAKTQAEYWRDRVKAEEDAEKVESGGITFGTIARA